MRTIDLSGPEGNAFMLIGLMREWGKQMNKPVHALVEEMMSGDYEELVAVMEREFPSIVRFINKPWDGPSMNICPTCEGAGCDECDFNGEIYE